MLDFETHQPVCWAFGAGLVNTAQLSSPNCESVSLTTRCWENLVAIFIYLLYELCVVLWPNWEKLMLQYLHCRFLLRMNLFVYSLVNWCWESPFTIFTLVWFLFRMNPFMFSLATWSWESLVAIFTLRVWFLFRIMKSFMSSLVTWCWESLIAIYTCTLAWLVWCLFGNMNWNNIQISRIADQIISYILVILRHETKPYTYSPVHNQCWLNHF